MEKIIEVVEKYRTVFQIPKDIEILIEEIPQGHNLLFESEKKKAVLKLDKQSIPDIPELMAQLKLGVERSPLIATMFFQKDMSPEEEVLASNFYTLSIPLIDAWVWSTMRDYLSSEELEMQLKELKNLWETAQLYKMSGELTETERQRRRMSFSLYLIFKVLGQEAKLKLIGGGETEKQRKKNLKEWVRYKKLLEEYSFKEPSAETLVELANKMNFPAKIEIKKEPYIHFSIKKQ